MRRQDLLGDVGREALHACVKVSIVGRPDLRKYTMNAAFGRIRHCYHDPFPSDMEVLQIPTDERGVPIVGTTCTIFDIQNAIKRIDQSGRVAIYPDEADAQTARRACIVEARQNVEAELAEASRDINYESGSGFIVSDYFVVTNAHVIETAAFDTNYRIQVENQRIGVLPCEIAYVDTQKDLALLHCPGLLLEQFNVAPMLLSNEEVPTGLAIFSVGYPISHNGNTALFVHGYVSGEKRTLSGQRLVVLNCPLNPGNSGGPILCHQEDGVLRVVAVASQKHIKAILDVKDAITIEEIRSSLETRSIADERGQAGRMRAMGAEPSGTTALKLLTLKLYDAFDRFCQFNLSNAIPGSSLLEFIAACATSYTGAHSDILCALQASLSVSAVTAGAQASATSIGVSIFSPGGGGESASGDADTTSYQQQP